MPSLAIRSIGAIFVLAASLLCGSTMAQQQPQEPAPPKPYKEVAVNLPAPVNDPSFEAFRAQLADIAERKDRAALAALIVPRGFFWERESGNEADEKKSGIDNLAAATGLDTIFGQRISTNAVAGEVDGTARVNGDIFARGSFAA